MTYNELIKLLMEAENVNEIDARREEIAQLIPKIKIMWGFDQKNSAHQYDLWMHSLHVVDNLPEDMDDPMLFLAALIHDIGKPDVQHPGNKPGDDDMHYKGHQKRSVEIVRDEIIPCLQEKGAGLSANDISRLIYYVEYHDDHINLLNSELRRHLEIPASFEEFKNLMKLEVADAKAHIMIPIIERRIATCSAWAGEYGEDVYCQMQMSLFGMF